MTAHACLFDTSTRADAIPAPLGATPLTGPRRRSRSAHTRAMAVCALLTVACFTSQPRPVYAQDQSNVVIVEVTEPGFIFDGKSIFNAQFSTPKGAPLVVEPYSVPGSFGPLARYYVHGLTDEHLIVSAPDHEEKTVIAAGETFVDVWLKRNKSSPSAPAASYWHGPVAPSFTAVAASPFRDNSDLFMASSDLTGRITVSRMDRAPVFTNETSPSGAGVTAFKDRLYLAWEGSRNRLLNVMSSPDGSGWGGDRKQTFQEITIGRPAIAGGDHELAIVWTGTDHRLNLKFSSDGLNWGPTHTLADQSDMSPAALWVGDSLFLAWLGIDNRLLNIGRWRSDGNFESITSSDTSEDAPSLSLLNGNLTVSWTGKGNRWVNAMAIKTIEFGFGQKKTFALVSDRTPTVLSYRWSGAGDQGVALPLFITSRGATNAAQRYWSDLNDTPDVQAQAVIEPSYVVATIMYAPPGTSGSWAKSTVEYRENSGTGTSLAAASSFKQGTKLRLEAGPIEVGTGLTLSTQDEETTELKVNTSTSTKLTGASTDGVNHDDDLIVLWLNPEVTVSLTSIDTRWRVRPRRGEGPRTIGVYVRWLLRPEEMPTGVAQTLAAAGIGVDEYLKIVSHNPFALAEAPKLDQARFLPLNTTVRYEPPATPGAVPPTSTVTLSTLSSVSSSTSSELSYDVSMALSHSFNLGPIKASFKAEQTWTWTSKTSRKSSSSSEQVAALTLTGPAHGYSGPATVEVYWDSLYRSFVFIPWEPWNVGKPGEAPTGASGMVVHADGSPATQTEVLLQYADGTKFRAITGLTGVFEFPRAPFGEAIITTGSHEERVVVGMSSIVIALPSKPACDYTFEPSRGRIDMQGGRLIVSVTTPDSCPLSPTSSEGWLRSSVVKRDNGKATISVDVSPNQTGAVRSGSVLVGTQSYRVFQDALSQPFTLSAVARTSTVVLRWSSVPGANTYSIRRRNFASGVTETIGSTVRPEYLDSKVARNESYVYSIVATDGSKEIAASYPVSAALGRGTRADFDGDQVADLAVFRPSTGTWTVAVPERRDVAWGVLGDLPVPGDYDGDGRTDIAVYRPSSAHWFILKSSSAYRTWDTYQWGTLGDQPMPGDYDGDGRTDVATYRPSNGRWSILTSGSTFRVGVGYSWGGPDDTPLSADFDGDGRSDLAVIRRSTGHWFVLLSSASYDDWVTYQWGTLGDIPLGGDFDGDGRSELVVYRASDSGGTWYILWSSTQYSSADGIVMGAVGDIPIPADHDGDGQLDLVVYRPSGGHWFVLTSRSHFTTWLTYQAGGPMDLPVSVYR